MSAPNLPFRLFIVCEYVDPARLAPASYVFCAACDTVFAVFCAACDTVFAPLDTVFDTAFVPLRHRLFRLLSPLLNAPEGVQGASRWNRAFGRSTAPSVVATPPENIAHVTASVSVSASACDARARVARRPDRRASSESRRRGASSESRRRGAPSGAARGARARGVMENAAGARFTRFALVGARARARECGASANSKTPTRWVFADTCRQATSHCLPTRSIARTSRRPSKGGGRDPPHSDPLPSNRSLESVL